MTRVEAEKLVKRLNEKFGIDARIKWWYLDEGFGDEGFDISLLTSGTIKFENQWRDLYFPVHDWLMENGATTVRLASNGRHIAVDWPEKEYEDAEIPQNPWQKHIKSIRMKYRRKS